MNQSAAFQNQIHPTAVYSSTNHTKYSIGSIAVIASLWAAIYLAGMFTPALLDDADSVHAEAAREMFLRHDWVTLHTNGIRYLEKAPLMYWGVAGSYLLFGVSEWSTRLPLMLGVLGLLFATYALGSQSYGDRGGFYSALVLGTALGPYLFTRFLIPDILVGLWLALSFYFFFADTERRATFTAVVLGTGSSLWIERAHQRSNWTSFPNRGNRTVSSSSWEPASPTTHPALLQ